MIIQKSWVGILIEDVAVRDGKKLNICIIN